MPIINIEPDAIRAIRAFLEEKGITDPVRIDLQSTGCCDPSLGLCIDRPGDQDLVHEAEGLKFIISPETHQTVGEVHVAHADEADRKGFVLTSSRPLSEWEGFGVCDIRTKPEEP